MCHKNLLKVITCTDPGKLPPGVGKFATTFLLAIVVLGYHISGNE